MADAAASSITGTVETPFLDRHAAAPPAPAPAFARRESPFLQEYEDEDGAPADAFAEMQAEVLAELEDDELEDALHALVDEVSEIHARMPTSRMHDEYREHALREHLAPLRRSLYELLDAAEGRADALGLAPESEGEVDELFDGLTLESPLPSPAFDEFWKGIKRKIKKVARVAKAVAKRGVALAAGPLLRAALGKLRALVRPLLEKVLKLALDKIPVAYRPLAAKVAARLGLRGPSAARSLPPARVTPGMTTPMTSNADTSDASGMAEPELGGEPEPSPEPAVPDPGMLQAELDLELSEALFAPERMDLESSEHTMEMSPARDPFGDLDLARERFVREILDAEDPREAGEIVERFLPAVMLALRTGIRLAGRPRVVAFLGGLIGKLIGPFVGKTAAPALGRVVADLGLRTVLQAEVEEEDGRRVAAEAVANVVEGTVQRLAEASPNALESPDLGEALLYEAFEASAAAVLPAATIRPELREAPDGGWVALPLRGPKRYRKHSRILHAVITPQMASSMATYGGGSLTDFLRDRLRLTLGRPIEARVHFYEAVPRTRLARISLSESVSGLSGSDPGAWSQLHPLTPDAASLLAGSPAMGRPFDEEADPRRPMIGERYYFLEIAGAPARPLGRQSHLHFTLDAPRGEIRVCLYLSEVVAQRLAVAIRKKEPIARQLALLRSVLAGPRHALGRRGPGRRMRIVVGAGGSAGASPRGHAHARAALRQMLLPTLTAWLFERLAELLATRAGELVAMTESPQDGVRIAVTFAVPQLTALRRALLGRAPLPAAWLGARAPATRIELHAGAGHD
jgi:hypothetical protein